ncbi:YheC/YheD family endospore coat-associated protein [Desertibacillus haloalkaliphilus]|uniref:YheC/YheD family endospore coat-associated protein n=1 Tax=Desertibacillus haloalkaliphilus TaxID=1328930 RepID=UPI001C26F39A|nr:YheC/YheD family protein [Desertibacillus haloalkaliphilus]MBU8905427.1 YheC/YheD family protein [Desertibacillus haloalkaliphilus]
MTKPLYVRKYQHDNNTLYVPEHTFRNWLKNKSFPTQLSFGSMTIPCRVAPHPDKKNEYMLTSDCWEKLSIPHEGYIHLFEHNRTVTIGPLVGIFTAGFTNSTLRPIGDRSLFFAKLLSVEQKVGAFYFIFGSHHINWESGTINGFFHTKKGWERCEVPFPNVVYDRLPNRRTESLPTYQKIKERFVNDYLIPWFNPGFFNKWEIYKQLRTDEHTSEHLPESYLNPTIEQIEALLEEHQHVYFKPAGGSLGLGIHQVIKLKDDPFYYCRFRDHQKNRLRRYSSLKRLLKKQFPTGLTNIIAQQGIHLLKVENKPVDFRIHTNKNIDGKWQISAIAAKVAGPGSVTTHIKSGGEIKTSHELFEEMGIGKEKIEHLKDTAITLSKAIDHKIAGNIGEIGLDLGIDKNEKIWMFEANSKPGRTIFSHTKLRYDDLISRCLPLAYAVYLSKQSLTRPELMFTT